MNENEPDVVSAPPPSVAVAVGTSLHKLAFPMGDGRTLFFYTFGSEHLEVPAEAYPVKSFEDLHV